MHLYAIAGVSGSAWALYFLAGGPLMWIPSLCTSRVLTDLPNLSDFRYAMAWISPGQLSASWMIMILAMMLPMTAAPLEHVRVRSFASSRIANMLSFIAGYVSVWMLAGAILIGIVFALRVSQVSPLISVGGAFLLTIGWLVCPWRQVSHNRCHRRPSLPPRHVAPFLPSLQFGAGHGVWCAISCGPIMFLLLLIPEHGQGAMLLAAMWVWAERLEPAKQLKFGLSLPMRALRAVRYYASKATRRARARLQPQEKSLHVYQ